jgi:ribosomal protein L40E
VQFEQAAQEQIITDQEKIAQAAAGPDIHCAYCGARNPATAKTCKQCGADLTEGTARAAGRVLGAHRDKPAPPLICPACGTSNPATALNCSKCGSSLAQPKPAPPPRAEAPRPFLGKGCLAILLGLIAVAVIIIFLATRTTGMVGEVSDVNWKRTISIEALVPVTKETWRDQVPEGAPIGECREKAHHIQDEPAPGAEEICGTPYTVDQGSGFGKVVQDCRYQVYADWCQYQTTEWRSVNAVVAEGRDLNPYWP